MKLKAVLAVTAALSFGGAFAQANFSDVPAGHWAKDAVEKMAAKGCIIGFPDGTFRGNEALTRYQAALILARCLQDAGAGNVNIGGFTAEDVESIKNAIQELSSELAALGVRVADVEDNAATKDDVAALEERVALLEETKDLPVEGGSEFDPAAITDLQDAIAALAEDQDAKITDLTNALDELVAQLDDLSSAQEDLISRVEALEGQEVDLSALDDLAAAIDDLTGAVDDLTAAQDDLGANLEDLTVTVDELAAGLDDLNARVDELSAANEETAAVLDEINSRIEELAGAIDDVNVRVDDLEGTVGDLSTTVDGLGEQVESNAASIVALQDLTVLLNEDIVGLEDRISALESDKADAEDVDARFTNLNRDLTDLTSRVTVVETNLSDLQGKFNTLNSAFGFSVSGSLSSTYYVARTNGADFDIDRIIPGTKFSTGVDGDDDTVTKDRPTDYVDLGGVRVPVSTDNGFSAPAFTWYDNDGDGKVDAHEITPGLNIIGDTDTTLSLTLDFANKGIEGKSAYSGAMASDTQAFNVHKVVAEFGLGDWNGTGGTVGVDGFSASDPNGIAVLDFYVKGITTVFDIAGNPIKFSVGENLKTQFTPYVFDNDKTGFGDGYLATVDGSSLPGIGALSPKIIVAYGSGKLIEVFDTNTDNPETVPVETDFSRRYLETVYTRAIRATISPLTDVTLGVSAAEQGSDVTTPTRNLDLRVLGADLNAKVGGWTIASEYATQEFRAQIEDDAVVTAQDSLFYVTASGSLGPVSLSGNYHAVSENFNGVSNDTGGDHPVTFGNNRKGFAVDASVALGGFSVKGYGAQEALFSDPTVSLTMFGASASGNVSIVKLGAYFDSLQGNNYTIDLDGNRPDVDDIDGDGNKTEIVEKGMNNKAITTVTRFGVTAGLNLAGFDVNGYYQNVMVDGVSVAKVPKLHTDNAAPFTAPRAPFDTDQATKVGVDVSGKVAGVNLKAGFMLDSGDAFVKPDGSPAHGYDAAWAPADLDQTTIYVDADTTLTAGILTLKPEVHYKSVVDADAGTDDYNLFKVGLSASTAVIPTFLAPSFNARVHYITNNHLDAAVFTATELFYSVGVKSDAFLFDKSTFALTWAGWQGNNRDYTLFKGTTPGYFSDDVTAGEITLGGIYGEWNYYDLNLAYGDFTLTNDGVVNNGQAFKISYKVKF